MAEFADLVLVIRGLSDKKVSPEIIAGDFLVDTGQKLAALIECEKDYENTSLSLVDSMDIGAIEVGSSVRVEIGTPRTGFGTIALNMDSLLGYPQAHVKEPLRYLLLDTNYSKDEVAPTGHIVTSYRAVLGLVAMLKTCAAFHDEQTETLVLIKNGKYEVPVRFVEQDLRSADIETMEALQRSILTGVHEKQCKSIMAEAVYEMTTMVPASDRFSFLIQHPDDLKMRFERGYSLYAEGFSYEKIRDEIEAAGIEYSAKMHKVFSDIQNQLLGIPAAIVVVATQMKESTKVNGDFFLSSGIFLGSLIFSIFMYFLLTNQRQTLEVIGIEINRQKTKLEKEHAAIAENFLSTFQSLASRYRTQRIALRVIKVVVIASFLGSALFFYEMNQPVREGISVVTEWIRKNISIVLLQLNW